MSDNSFVIVRIRGEIGVKRKINETMKYLHLLKKFNATIVADNESYRGMVKESKDYITWGLPTSQLVVELLLKRGKLVGGELITPEYITKKTGLNSVEEVAEAIVSSKITLKDIEGLKPVFRLSPPKGGFKRTTKSNIKNGGELGYRKDISSLVFRML